MDKKTVMSIAKRQERKEREKESRRQDILQSAIRVFRQNGFVKTSMELVAEDAALAVGTLYRYYKSKEELYVSIVFDAIEVMHDGLRAIAESSDAPSVKLEHAWDYFYQFYQKNTMYYQAFISLHDPGFAGAFSEEAHDAVERFSSNNFHLLAKIIREGIEAKAFYPYKPQAAADYLWSTFVGLANLAETRKQLGGPASDLGKLHEATWKMIRRTFEL